jgi:hypothetical protein
MTGDLAISKATPALTLNKAAVGQACSVLAQDAGSARWGITLAGATTSDFKIDRYNDSGVYQDSPMSIIRATGAPVFANAGLWRTGLGATTVGSAVFVAVDAAAARTAIGATTTGSAVLIAADTAAARTATATPAIPTASGSVPGTFTFINPGVGAAAVLPAGGTWACFGLRYDDGTANPFGTYDGNIITDNVAAGGTTVGAALANRFWLGFCWRIS